MFGCLEMGLGALFLMDSGAACLELYVSLEIDVHLYIYGMDMNLGNGRESSKWT